MRVDIRQVKSFQQAWDLYKENVMSKASPENDTEMLCELAFFAGAHMCFGRLMLLRTLPDTKAFREFQELRLELETVTERLKGEEVH